MKKTFCLILLVILVTIFTGWLFVKTTIIQPKDTRLRFYEIITASKNTRSDLDVKDQKSSWLDQLNALNIKHLKHCEQIQYYNQTAHLTRHVSPLDDDYLASASSLQLTVANYFLESPELQDLSEFGETEFDKVMSEIKHFKATLIDAGITKSLDELARDSKNFSVNLQDIKQIYNDLIAKAEGTLTSRFLTYEIPKGSAEVSTQAHRWSSPALYRKEKNAMITFFNSEQYDINIAAFISVHEIFPGHHLHAYAGNTRPICAGDIPSKSSWLLEGWATYAEFIADEEGFFAKPEHKLSWLDYRLIRAMRIILDVKRMEGITDYEALNQIWNERMPSRLADRFSMEFNRISKSRQQHMSYILGYNVILYTKTKLMEELGDDFDEKKFHDVILRLEHKDPIVFYDTVKVGMEMPTDLQN